MKKHLKTITASLLALAAFSTVLIAQIPETEAPDPEGIIKKAVAKLGGEKYLAVRSVSSEGKLSIREAERITSFQSFTDVLIYPDRERTDFVERGNRTVQVNTGKEGWFFNELFKTFGPQSDKQLESFGLSLKTHYDYLLRGAWKGNAELKYAGRRQSTIGKRNDVLRLEFPDELWIEYEFSDESLPMKVVYPTKNADGIEIKEEYRYAQFILTDGVLFPFAVDHFTDGAMSFRVNYIEVKFNRSISDDIFKKPEDPKKIKKLKI
ncbi:MAG: hypothetical protein R2684_09995 [Pyrinomonadaceae bacterium]